MVAEQHHFRGVLGEVDVGGRVRAFLQDLVGQDDPVVTAHLDVDAGLLLERADNGRRELGMLAAVEGDRGTPAIAAVSGTGAAAGGEKRRRGKRPGGDGQPLADARRSYRLAVTAATHVPSFLPDYAGGPCTWLIPCSRGKQLPEGLVPRAGLRLRLG